MKEINNIVQQFSQQFSREGMECALATVINVEGSSYRRVGARMLIFQDGTWVGGISGGCLEGDALRKAKMVMHNKKNGKKSKIVTYDTREEGSQSIGIGLGCNGLIDVLISPIDKTQIDNPIKILQQCTQQREEHILLTVVELENAKKNATNQTELVGQILTIDSFPKKINLTDQELENLKGFISKVKTKQQSKIVEFQTDNSTIKLLIEFLAPPIHTLVFGGQYDVLSLLQINQVLGWQSTLICNPQKTNALSLELADTVLDKREDFVLPNIDNFTVAILMAHDYETDKQNLEKLLALQMTLQTDKNTSFSIP